MTEPYLFEKTIGQQMGDLCRLAVGDAKVTQTGEIITLEDMPGRGAFGVSVEVPYTSSGVQSVHLTRCGKNLLNIDSMLNTALSKQPDGKYKLANVNGSRFSGPQQLYLNKTIPSISMTGIIDEFYGPNVQDYRMIQCLTGGKSLEFNYSSSMGYRGNTQANTKVSSFRLYFEGGAENYGSYTVFHDLMILFGSAPAENQYEPYTGDTYTITLPADFYGGSIDLEASTVTSRYAADGTELAKPVVTEIDPISIPILAGVNNVWADVGDVAVSYYAADAETFRPSVWYPTIYRGLTSARYLIKRASGAIASFDDAIAAPLVGLRVALPWRSEGYQSVSVTVNGTLTTITLPTTIYGGYLDVVTGQLVATHDENGNLLANQKLYFLPPVNINALAGVNTVQSDAGDVAVSYRIDNG